MGTYEGLEGLARAWTCKISSRRQIGDGRLGESKCTIEDDRCQHQKVGSLRHFEIAMVQRHMLGERRLKWSRHGQSVEIVVMRDCNMIGSTVRRAHSTRRTHWRGVKLRVEGRDVLMRAWGGCLPWAYSVSYLEGEQGVENWLCRTRSWSQGALASGSRVACGEESRCGQDADKMQMRVEEAPLGRGLVIDGRGLSPLIERPRHWAHDARRQPMTTPSRSWNPAADRPSHPR
ncbi:hypothetical protein EJ04DRAFT_9641 [Polyplosphaeria fusca]|uniref:Uncharacterized protein n=1 Tax=Polyplosphaeria fusca TaxID=682080 RepID=A0A9P4R4Q1_9PLEO|nr:hypothetical protein EJ04DRAFT_9641 [Polyplosphaeria fusca]